MRIHPTSPHVLHACREGVWLTSPGVLWGMIQEDGVLDPLLWATQSLYQRIKSWVHIAVVSKIHFQWELESCHDYFHIFYWTDFLAAALKRQDSGLLVLLFHICFSVFLLVSSGGDLQLSLEQFVAVWETDKSDRQGWIAFMGWKWGAASSGVV